MDDDRVMCDECRAKCDIRNEKPKRCADFLPIRGLDDMRDGRQRWPNLEVRHVSVSTVQRRGKR